MTRNPIRRALALACGGALLVVWQLGASAQAFTPEDGPDLQVDTVREALQATGYVVSAPMAWEERATVIEAHAADGVHVVRAFVFSDRQAAAAAHGQAYARLASINGTVQDSNDTGPQLLSGYGASTWRRNVALVQSSPDTFAQLVPAEVDCWDLAQLGPDLSQPTYRVDSSLVALLDNLAGR
jgi:hypothetical protein